MLDRRLPLLSCQLLCALFAILATVHADFQPSNDPPNASFSGQILLRNSTGQNLTGLLPLSSPAAQGDNSLLDGHLSLVTDSNFGKISGGAIALVSCDRYSGNLQVGDIFDSLQKNHNTTAVIFYSNTTNYCNASSSQPYQIPIYTTTGTPGTQAVLEASQNNNNAPAVQIIRSNSDTDMSGGGNDQNDGQNNPLGPSPSTAVAMIILYSITGIITALFLVIIVTGAIRAHRHPDRYGPRDVMGRPRQSRARGLGRAILDTLPIVKFGEKEQPKPADVELGSTSEARAVDSERDAARTSTAANEERDASQTRDGNTTETARNVAANGSSVHEHDELQEGIAPAVAGAAAASTTDTENSPEEALGCSICTDDFEKGQDIRVLPCNHKFHPECVDPWLLNVSGTCPLCRVDLRPVVTNGSTNSTPDDPNHLAPPLESTSAENSNDLSHRRRSNLRDILSFRTRPNASADERISALRRLREQRRNGDGSSENVGEESAEDTANSRRRGNNARMSVRLSGMFGRGRREESPQPPSSLQQTVNGSGSGLDQQPREQR